MPVISLRLFRAVLLGLAPFITGCVGVIGFYDVVDRIDAPQIVVYDRETLYSRPGGTRMTRAEVERLWGRPDSIESGEGVERWTYVSESWRLHGYMPAVIVPIPLILPYGNCSVTLTLEDDQVASAEVLRSSGGCALLGPFMEAEGFQWYANHWAESGPKSSAQVKATWLDRNQRPRR